VLTYPSKEALNVTMDRHAVSVDLPKTAKIVVPPTDHDLTVIIPAFNEEQRLPWTLRELVAFLSQWGVDYRVLVADDGSTDRTATLTNAFGPRCSTIRLLRQGGKGRAVRTAMLHATGRLLAFTDADLPFDLTALRRGYRWIDAGTCEVVFGARDLNDSVHVAPRRVSRQLATLVFRQVAKWMISREVTDTQCGLKLFSRRAALEIFSRGTVDGFSFDAEIVILTHSLGLTLQRVPVTLINDYASTLSLRRNALPMLWDVVKLWLREHFGQSRPDPQFIYEGWDGRFEEDRKRLAA
jgi:dolichyl-phosphate beta-glucosyltransferase